MFKKWMRYVLMDQAGDDGAAAGGTVVAAETPAVAATPADAEQPTASVLSSAASTEPKGIPEKYQVKNEDGTLNLEASSTKLAEAYANAEKRIGSGDLPPKAATEYEVKVPESLADVWKTDADPLLDAFKDKAFAAGMTQAQFDLVIDQYGQIAPGLVAGNAQLSAEDCTADLKKEWKTDADFTEGVKSAVATVKAYGGEEAAAILEKYGNDPQLIRLMSKIGKELGEDTALDAGQQLGGDTIESLLASPAYKDPKDPAHAAVSAKVSAYYASKAAKDAKSGGTPIGL